MENKDFQAAIKYCNDELKKNKRNIEVYLLRGSAYNQMGKTELAIDDFKQAHQLDPSNLEILKKLFFSYAKIQDIENAILTCEKIIKQFPSDNDELVFQEICRLLMAREDYHSCLKLLKDIVKRSEEHHIYQHLMGLNYFYLREYDNAIKWFKKAYKSEPDVKYLISLVEGYEKTNEIKKAYKELHSYWIDNQYNIDLLKNNKIAILDKLAELCLINNDFDEAIDWYNELSNCYDTREEKIAVEHKKAHIYKMLKDYDEALNIYQMIIKTNTNSIYEFLESADLYKRQGKYKEAYEEYKKVLHLEPYNLAANLNLANICLLKNDYNQAKEIMKKLHQENKSNVTYLTKSTNIYLELLEKENYSDEKTEENKQFLYEVLADLIILNPNDIGNYEKLINLCIEDDKINYAKDIIETAIRSTNNIKARLLQAYVLSFIDEEASELYYQRYIAFQGDMNEVLFYKGKRDYILGNYNEALSNIEECLSNNHYHIEALELIFQIYIKLKKWDKVLEVADLLIMSDEYNPEYHFKTGIVLARIKRYEESIPYFQKAIILNNFHLDAYYNLGNVYFKLKDFEESLNCYKIIVQLNPDYNKDVYIKIAKIYKNGG